MNGNGRLHQVADRAGRWSRPASCPCRAVPSYFVERRLGVERIDLAGRAVHEQEDGVLGLGREVRRLGREQVRRPVAGARPRRAWRAKKPSRDEQVDQGQAGEPAADLPEELAAGAAAGGRVRDVAGRSCSAIGVAASSPMSVGVDELVQVEDHAADLLERPATGLLRVDRLARAGRVGDQLAASRSRKRSIAARSLGGRRPAEGQQEGQLDLLRRVVAGLLDEPGRRSARACRLTKSPLNSVRACGATLVTFRRGGDCASCRRSRAPRASAPAATA